MRRAARVAAWTAAAIVLLVLALVGSALVAANTAGGRGAIERWTARLTSGRVRISGLAGSFPSVIDVGQLSLSDERGVWLTAQRISLRWSPLDLLAWNLRVASLEVARLDLSRPPATSPSGSSSSGGRPTLPHIDVAQLGIDALVLEPALAGSQTSLAVRGSAHLESLDDATANVTARRTDGNGDYEIHLHFDPSRMDATLKLEEPASGPLEHLLQLPGLGALAVTASLHGPHSAERVELDARAGDLHATVQGTLDLERRSAELDYSLESPAVAPRPELSWRSVNLKGSWHGSVTTPQASARLLIEGLELPGHAGLSMLSANLSASGGALEAHATASGLALPGLAGSPAAGAVARLLASSPVRLDATLSLDRPERPLRLTATHRLLSMQVQAVTAGERSATFQVRVPDVTPFASLVGARVAALGRLRAVSGSLAASGKLAETAAATRLDVDVGANLGGTPKLTALLGGASRVQLSASWTDRAVDIERLQVTGRALSLSGSGAAEMAGTASGLQSLHARWSLALPRLAAISPALDGSLTLSGEIAGPVHALATQMQASSTLSIRGSPQGTVDASLKVRGLPSALAATLQAHGSFDGAPLDLQASLDRGRDGLFHFVVQRTDWRSVHLDANVTTGAKLAQGSGAMSFRIGRLADLQPLIGKPIEGSIAGSATLSPDAGRTRAQVRLEARDVGTSGVSANAQLTGSGPLDGLPLQLTVQSADLAGAPARLDAAVRLSLTDRVLSLEKLEADYRGQSLRLLSPARVAFAGGLRVSGLKLGVQQATLSVAGEISPALGLRASLSHVDAALVDSFAPHLLAQGTLGAEAQLHGTLAAPVGRASLEVSGLRMANSAARDLPALNLKGTAELEGTAARIDAELDAGRASQLKLTGRAPLAAAGALDLKLSGELSAALANPLLEAHGERAEGTLAVNATVTGPAHAPEIGGSIELTHGDIRDYAQGVHLDDITARIVGGQGILRIASLTAHAGAGVVSMGGTLGVLQPKLPVDITLTAKNAQPITNDILTANLDADIHVQGTLRQRIEVSGTVHVNRAQIGVPNSLPPNVAVLDVRRPGEAPPQPAERRLVIGLDLALSAPREILVQGRGLDAALGGSLTIGGTTETPRVRGGFELIMGTFTLASTQLSFTTGEVSFNGAGLRGKIDPTLDFTAQAIAADATVTLRVTGFADAPKFTLSSTPQLPQDEILARLLFGESASQLTGLQVAEIGAALASLSGIGGGSGLNPLAKVQKALGLNRLTVGSATTTAPNGTTQSSGASITAGRYVSSRVFVAATQNTTGTSQLEVDIDLSKHLKLQTRLGNGSATAQGTTPENDPGSSIGLSYQFQY